MRRTPAPDETVKAVSEDAELPAFSLWVAYALEDAEQRRHHAYGLLMIAKPPVSGARHLAWPLIRRFTERVFTEDRRAVEEGEDRNQEVFPLILHVRDVLRRNGIPLPPSPPSAPKTRTVSPAPPGQHVSGRPGTSGRRRHRIDTRF
ncbi:hypothetical protein [Streptomyces europaeiscabiei]|uniref:hypothetical protein n=1 Tax=Streptomyces europaeiscabiei TaxID=146819 RepID=UPI0038D48D48